MGYYDKIGAIQRDQLVDAFDLWKTESITDEDYIKLVKSIIE